MAVTFTLAGLQTELESFRAALATRDWAGALDAANNYYAVRRGYIDEASAEGTSVKVPKEPTPTLFEQIKLSKEIAASVVKPRVIHGRTSFRVRG